MPTATPSPSARARQSPRLMPNQASPPPAGMNPHPRNGLPSSRTPAPQMAAPPRPAPPPDPPRHAQYEEQRDVQRRAPLDRHRAADQPGGREAPPGDAEGGFLGARLQRLQPAPPPLVPVEYQAPERGQDEQH